MARVTWVCRDRWNICFQRFVQSCQDCYKDFSECRMIAYFEFASASYYRCPLLSSMNAHKARNAARMRCGAGHEGFVLEPLSLSEAFSDAVQFFQKQLSCTELVNLNLVAWESMRRREKKTLAYVEQESELTWVCAGLLIMCFYAC